jgi:DNA repair protein RadC
MNELNNEQGQGDVESPFPARRDRVKVRRPQDALPLLADIRSAEQETFNVIVLDGSHQLISVHIVTVGLANQSQVHPRETFKWAIRNNGVSVMIAHNHPSGNLDPSESDLACTRRLCEAGRVIGIPVIDHIIVTTEGWVSLREQNPECFG